MVAGRRGRNAPIEPTWAVAIALLLGTGCGEDETTAPGESSGSDTSESARSATGPDGAAELGSGSASPPEIPSTLARPPLPEDRLRQMDLVEDLTEMAAARLTEWGALLRDRRFTEAEEFLTEDFLGHDVAAPGAVEEHALPLDILDTDYEVTAPPVRARGDFIESMRTLLADYASLELVHPKPKGGEFSVGMPGWGVLPVKLSVHGRSADGGPRACFAKWTVRLKEIRGNWYLDRVFLESRHDQQRAQFLFTDVSVPAGVAHQYVRFGEPGNESFRWNGAACEDFDGDGYWDLFVTGRDRNRLYRNRGDGTFEDVAEEAGVASPVDGTGALFFDADSDGDLDLLLAGTGVLREDGRTRTPCCYWRNRGDGSFEEATVEAGFLRDQVPFSVCAADIDDDGHLDVYVCGYNAEGFTAPNSWHAATNGTHNALYRNRGDGTFEECSVERGVDDISWSYAASFADFDEDGDQDLYLANDYGPNRLFVNDGSGHFTDQAEALGVWDVGNGMGVTWGDCDADGDLDLYVSNMSSSAGKRILKRLLGPPAEPDGESGDTGETLFKLAAGNSIFEWTGERFERISPKLGGVEANWAWSAQFLDFDLDGRQDIACVNGFISGDSGAAFKDT